MKIRTISDKNVGQWL